MVCVQKRIQQSLYMIFALFISTGLASGQKAEGRLTGQVADRSGGVIVKAVVTAIDSRGVETVVTTDERGAFVLDGLSPGRFTVRVVAEGFREYQQTDVEIHAGQRQVLNIRLAATFGKEKMNVKSDNQSLSTEPGNDKGGVVLTGADLEALPDDPEDLANALRAMAGPGAGLSGGQLYLDGFSNGKIPPKSIIREIRINQNPFAAENDRIGYGRIEIFTRAGTGDYHASFIGLYNNQSFNSRNPFAVNRPPFQLRYYSGDLSGPILAGRATFLFNASRREIDDNAIVHATILDPALNITSFNQAFVTPRRITDVNPRIDFQINKNNTIVGRYDFSRSSLNNAGVGDFALPSRGFDTLNTEHRAQFSETAVIGPALVNELRFQYVHSRLSQTRATSSSRPTIRVQDAFIDGGPERGFSLSNSTRWEVHDNATWVSGIHTFRSGGRLRLVTIDEDSRYNFSGTFVFLGGMAPLLDEGNQIMRGPDGLPRISNITSLERFRRTLLFQRQGLDPSEVFARGGGATFLTISGGQPREGVRQTDLGAFFQGDSKVRANFTLSYGLRYEVQNNIDARHDFAPRLAFAWSPGSNPSPARKLVIRGGIGVFYERFGENLTLRSNRFDGLNHLQFTIADPEILGEFPAIPSADRLASLHQPQTIIKVADDLKTPFTLQAGVSFERQLIPGLNITAAYIESRGGHQLRSRNINAPLPGTFDPESPASGIRPFQNAGNIFQYESSGIFRQHQLVINVTGRPIRRFTMFGSYFLTRATGDTEGPESFPRDSYDLTGEFGRTSLDVRHRAFFGGAANLPMRISVSPFVIVSSGIPFNIVTGIDSNGDTIAAERPAFAADPSRPGVRATRFGVFDLNPQPGQVLIPRNYGESPSYLTMSLRVGKTFDLTRSESSRRAASPAQRPAAGASSSTKGASATRPSSGGQPRAYNLTISLLVFNIFNKTNSGIPVGNLSSPLFGQSTTLGVPAGVSLAGGNAASSNRRIDFNVRFAF